MNQRAVGSYERFLLLAASVGAGVPRGWEK